MDSKFGRGRVAGNTKLTAAALGEPRRALGDIGNLASLRSALPNPEDVITRGARGVHKKSSRKKVQTLTEVLSAHSKVACGLADIIDIDGEDADNQLAAVEYVEDLYEYYKLAEKSNMIRDYMSWQYEMNEKHRVILVDWLIEVHTKCDLAPETLYLTIHIVDRFLSTQSVSKKELQLLGISSMLIACKYEEIWAPQVADCVLIADNIYTKEQLLEMEKVILSKLGWTLTVPTPYVFLARFVKAAAGDKKIENMVYFLAELGLMQYAMILFSPSMFASSAVYAARCTLNKIPPWNETLKLHTGFSDSDIIECAKQLVSFHSGAAKDKSQTVYKKYASPEFNSVALLDPAKSLLG